MKKILTIAIVLTCMVLPHMSVAKDLPKQPFGVMVGALFADGVTSVAWAGQYDINYTTFGSFDVEGKLGALFNQTDRKIVRVFPVMMHKSVGIFHVGLGAGLWHYLNDGNDVSEEAYRLEVGLQPLGIELNAFGEACPDEKDYFTGASLAFKF